MPKGKKELKIPYAKKSEAVEKTIHNVCYRSYNEKDRLAFLQRPELAYFTLYYFEQYFDDMLKE